jgi:hypothetical protein
VPWTTCERRERRPMPSELEQQLERALNAPPARPPEAARRAALDALPVAPRRRRGRVPLVLVLGMAILLASAVTLYASPDARQAIGIETYTPKHPFKPGPQRLQVPAGASGVAMLAGGRMWATAHAVSINGAKASAVELSPNALNVAVGRGHNLVAVHTNGSGERVLRHTEGQVVAISWAPNPIEIAYIVKRGGHYRLHLIEGDGDNDRLVDPSVAPVRPAWRWDNGTLAYVSANGHVVIRDLIHARSDVLPRGCIGAASHIAYAPTGSALAVAAGSAIAVVDARHRVAHCQQVLSQTIFGIVPPASGLTWLSPTSVAVAQMRNVSQFRWAGGKLRALRRPLETRGDPRGLAALPGNRMLIALGGHRLRVVEVDASTLRIRRVLLDAPPVNGQAPLSLR